MLLVHLSPAFDQNAQRWHGGKFWTQRPIADTCLVVHFKTGNLVPLFADSLSKKLQILSKWIQVPIPLVLTNGNWAKRTCSPWNKVARWRTWQLRLLQVLLIKRVFTRSSGEFFHCAFSNLRGRLISLLFSLLFREFEAQIRTNEGEDPLDIWYRYAKDTM